MRRFAINDSRVKEGMIGKNRLAFSFLIHMPIVPGYALVCPLRNAMYAPSYLTIL